MPIPQTNTSNNALAPFAGKDFSQHTVEQEMIVIYGSSYIPLSEMIQKDINDKDRRHQDF